MAGAVQWSINQFWGQLQNLKSQIDQVDSTLRANKARLTALYSAARAANDPRRDAMLGPLIHQNSVLRLTYLQPIKDKFNAAVKAADSALRSAGYTTPQLNGLGVVVAIAPAAAVTAVLLALAAVAVVMRLTQAQVTNTETVAKIIADPTTTPEQKLALAKGVAEATDKMNKSLPPPGGFDFGDLVPLAALVAIILLGPRILDMLPKRRAAA